MPVRVLENPVCLSSTERENTQETLLLSFKVKSSNAADGKRQQNAPEYLTSVYFYPVPLTSS